MDPRELKLLEVNARYMRHEMFQQLVVNIRRDGKLTSVPFAWYDGSEYEVLSGNHRVAAAVEAGLASIEVMLTDDELTDDQRIAIQLSHNAISGEDDPQLLRQLFERIGNVDMRLYSGLDDQALDLLSEVDPISFTEASLKFANVSMIFLPEDLAEAQAILGEALTSASGADEIWLNRIPEYDSLLDALDTTSSAHGIRNTATAMMIIMEMFRAHIGDLAEAIEERGDSEWVPISVLLGTDKIPVSLARGLAKRIDKELAGGKIETRWQIVERLL